MAGYETERQIFEARMSAQWKTTSIAWDNDDFIPTPGTAWVRFTIINSDANNASLGSNILIRDTGFLDIGIFVPVGTGTNTARGYVDTIAAIFRNWSSGGITCKAPVIKRVGELNGWFQYNVTVPFDRDTTF